MTDMPPTECLALLRSSLVGRLGMVGADGKPYTIPLRYVWHDQAIYLRFAYDGRKQDALANTRRVCFETDEVRDDFSHYASVIVEGTLVDIHDEAEKRSALVALNDKYAQLSGLPTPGPNPVTQGVAIRRVLVESMSGRKNDIEPARAVKPAPRWYDELDAYARAHRP